MPIARSAFRSRFYTSSSRRDVVVVLSKSMSFRQTLHRVRCLVSLRSRKLTTMLCSHKYVFFDVEGFKFYVLTDALPSFDFVLGFFSKVGRPRTPHHA